MKKREGEFLAEQHIPHNSEVFDYIKELHMYLWQFVRCVTPGASGQLDDYVDDAVEKLRGEKEKIEEEEK